MKDLLIIMYKKGYRIMKKSIFSILFFIVFMLVGCGKDDGKSHLGNTGMPGSDAGNGYNQNISMEILKNAVVDVLGENYWPNMEMDAEMLETVYGIKPEMYDDYFAESPMISVNVDTLIIVKAKEDQIEAVEEALETYRERNINEALQYPQNIGKVQAARIESFDNYVCFVQLGADTREASDAGGDEAVAEQCLEENERALDAIEKALLR